MSVLRAPGAARAQGSARAPAARRRLASRTVFGRLAREPLVHFLLAGFVLFAAGEAWRRHETLYRIEVTPAHVAQIANSYALQFGTKPDPATLEELVQRDTHDEMLFRQGEALKLGRDDEIVRRRIAQKMQFLVQDLSPPPEPTEAQLAAYYAAHSARYATPARATFSHIFFSAQASGDAAARARAAELLEALPNDLARAPDRGDPFPDLYDFSAYGPQQVARLFGHTPFTQAVFEAPVGRWSGPYRSAYGWHLIHVDARDAPGRQPFAQVREAVRADYLQDAQGAANQAALAKLARRFTVVRADQEGRR